MGKIRYHISKTEFKQAWKRNKGNVAAIARDFNVPWDVARRKVTLWGYERLHTRNTYSFNENYLDQIDEHKKGFWLGYLFGNSYLSLDGTRAHCTTVSTNRERQLLFDLVKDLKGTHNIKPTSRVYLTSNHFAEVLVSHGKGYKWKCKEPPTVYPEIGDAYQLDFIHGWIRGNSSCLLDNRTGKRILFISSREPGVLQNIHDFIGIGGSLKERSQKNGWKLIYGGANQIAHLESLGIQLPSEQFVKERRMQNPLAKPILNV